MPSPTTGQLAYAWVAFALLLVVIIGGLNWFSVSVGKYDFVVHLCKQQNKKGTAGTCPRAIYGAVGGCAILLLIMVLVGIAVWASMQKK